jgi:endogenous inhibitor of DNA gyrase (YacG/DUF329 family)
VPDPSASAEICPICSRPAAPKLRPFCSVRCADVDLGRWFTGQYRMPARPDEEEDGAEDS